MVVLVLCEVWYHERTIMVLPYNNNYGVSCGIAYYSHSTSYLLFGEVSVCSIVQYLPQYSTYCTWVQDLLENWCIVSTLVEYVGSRKWLGTITHMLYHIAEKANSDCRCFLTW